MNGDYTNPAVTALASRWWVLVARGIAAVLFGTLAVVQPEIGLLTLVMLFGAYALVDGVFNIALAGVNAGAGRRWIAVLATGLVSIAAGAVTFLWPGITMVVLLTVIAVWAVITGVTEILAAIRLRTEITNEWLLAASGALSIAFGVLVFAYPASGAIAIVWMIGAYAIVFGALLIGVGWRLHRWSEARERGIPSGGAPSPA